MLAIALYSLLKIMMKKITITLDFIYDFTIIYSDKGVLQTSFVPKKTNRQTMKHQNLPLWLNEAIKEIKNLFKNHPADFSHIPIDYTGVTEFRKKVYEKLKKIKPGRTISYQDLAHKIKTPKAARAVGTAMSTNKVPLIIPCHRVVRADGSLGNYSAIGGMKTKELIIATERRGI